jgi:hypothetical protein
MARYMPMTGIDCLIPHGGLPNPQRDSIGGNSVLG